MKRRKTRQLKIDCVLCSRHCSQNKRLRASSLSLSLLRSRSRHSTSPSLSLRLFSARTPPFRRSRRSSSFREIRFVEKSLKRRRRRSLTRLFETTTTTTTKKTRNDQSKTERQQNELLNETSTKGSVPRVHSQRSRGVV